MELDGLRAAAAADDAAADDDDDEEEEEEEQEEVEEVAVFVVEKNNWEVSLMRSCKVRRCSSRNKLWSATSKTGDSAALEATTEEEEEEEEEEEVLSLALSLALPTPLSSGSISNGITGSKIDSMFNLFHKLLIGTTSYFPTNKSSLKYLSTLEQKFLKY